MESLNRHYVPWVGGVSELEDVVTALTRNCEVLSLDVFRAKSQADDSGGHFLQYA